MDTLLVGALASTVAPAQRVDLIRLLDTRGVVSAVPAILKLSLSQEKAVALAALSAMRSLAGPEELGSLIGLARSSADVEIKDAAENAIVGVCSGSSGAAAEPVLQALQQAKEATERACWIRVLARVGYDRALPAIQAAANDSEPDVAAAALGQLGHWPSPAPIETLLKSIDSATNPGLRQRALASTLDLATTATDEALAPEGNIVGWLRRVNAVSTSVEDKRRILGLLGRLRTVESFQLLLPYLDDPGLRTEAASGVVQLASALAREESVPQLRATLERISATVTNADIQARARQVVKTLVQSKPSASLFDGHSLTGWEGDTNVWRMRGGSIVGGSLKGNPQNEFLATTRSYTNFVLRLEYNLVGTEGFVNSGVQFRSIRMAKPANEMNGYQADIGAGYSGCLYDESRRNTFLAHANQETIHRLEKTNDWNHYEVRCEGYHIQILLNGEKTIDYIEADPAIPQHGLIGLQIHGGNKAEVSFRSITIQEF